MEFEGHRFADVTELVGALRASWPGVWVEPREGGDPLPFTWALRLGDQHSDWQTPVVEALAMLLTDPDDGIAYGAIESLRSAPWDVGPALANAVVGQLDGLSRRDSARSVERSALADVASVLALSPGKAAMPEALADQIGGHVDERDGFPDTAFVALAMSSTSGRDAAASELAGWLAASAEDGASLDESRVDRILAQGPSASEVVAGAIAARDAGLAAAFGTAAKARLEAAAARLEAALKSPDYPPVLKTRMKAQRGSHAKRWSSLASALNFPAGRFKG